jgi:hypothetical protein
MMRAALRAAVFLFVVSTVLLGVTARVKLRADAPQVESIDDRATKLGVGDRIGEATIDGVIRGPLPGFRLRLADCDRPVFVLIVSLVSAAEPQVADQIYEDSPYRSTDIYQGQIIERFSHASKWAYYIASRVWASWSNARNDASNVFARAYVPIDCKVSTSRYVAWANAANQFR